MAQTENTIVLGVDEHELPVGIMIDGVFHKTFKLRDMTGKAEEAINDKKINKDVSKVITELLLNVVESIGTVTNINRNIIKQLTIADREYMIIKNYKQSIGDDLEWQANCPSCNSKFDITINDVNDIKTYFLGSNEPKTFKCTLPVGYTDEFGVKHTELEFSMSDGFVQEQFLKVVKENTSKAISTLYSMTCEKFGTMQNWNPKIFASLIKKDRKAIEKAIEELEVGAETFVKTECPDCGSEHDYTIPLLKLLGE